MVFKTIFFAAKKFIRIYQSVQKILDDSNPDSINCFKKSKKKIKLFLKSKDFEPFSMFK